MTDSWANVITRHDYLPFGEELSGGYAGRNAQWAPGGDNVGTRFTGQVRDQESGLDYFNARYFAGALGRFTSPDPGNAGADLTDPQTWNAYAYVRNNPLALTDPSGMYLIGPDPGDGWGDDPCFVYDAWCAGPGPVPPGWGGGGGGAPSGGGGGGRGGTSSGGSASSTGNSSGTSQPFPPGSFPGGETLGLPLGLSVPNPLSAEVLLDLWGWDCSGGICVPGFGPLEARPAWLNDITSVFGYDQNIPLQSCFVDVFLKSAANNLNPFLTGSGDVTSGGFQAASALKYNQALKYAATTASRTFGTPNLLYPFKSSTFRGILQSSQELGKAAGWAGMDVSLGQALYSEIQAMRRGECQ